MSIEFIRQEVSDADKHWQTICDITELKNLKGYLRKIKKPNGQVDDIRTTDYQEHAIFYGVASKTSRGLVGTIYGKDPVVDMPSGLDYAITNIDGNGIGIAQQSRAVCSDVIRFGRCGLWVDFAQTGGNLTLADQGQYFATINRYKPWQIINWRQEQVGSSMKLSLVVLCEYRPKVDGFKVKSEKIYRQLELVANEDGSGLVYQVIIWTFQETNSGGQGEWVPGPAVQPTDAQGQPFDFIPFGFVGSENNDPSIDRAPMRDLVEINIGHYRNSADYEDTVFYAGQTQPYMTGATQQYFDLMDKQQFYIGSRQLMPVPEGGTFGFANPGANPTVRQAMIDKVELMVSLGASFIDKSNAPRTAAEANSNDRTETSELALIASNVTDAYSMALDWAARFQGSDSGQFELNSDFSAIMATPQMFTAWVKALIDGAVPFSEYAGWLQRNGLVDPEKTVEQLRDELETDQLAGGAGLDTP